MARQKPVWGPGLLVLGQGGLSGMLRAAQTPRTDSGVSISWKQALGVEAGNAQALLSGSSEPGRVAHTVYGPSLDKAGGGHMVTKGDLTWGS